MKLTYIMIVAVLLLTAWTFVTADDYKYGLENRFSKARNEVENPKASELDKRSCYEAGEFCFFSVPGLFICCSSVCLFHVCL
nr:conotoxin precursor O1 [Conus ebraeus]UMA82856.1 conotoxin precursor O1 [Conus ebraeus]DAZ85887.1 TPA_inf: conotoxin precursor O1 [Conus ebraeus]DAZ86038.1 TPA_inf: conotoxin precursor O1 [Conus ebraeus]